MSATMQRTFAAYTECPQCDVVDLHWLKAPRRRVRREDYADDNSFHFARTIENISMTSFLGSFGGPSRVSLWEEDRADVVRMCRKCDSEWCEY